MIISFFTKYNPQKTKPNEKNEWVKFECDGCGEIKEKLLSQMKQKNNNIKSKKTFCNRGCLKKYHLNRTCSVDGCDNKPRSKNFCNKHLYHYLEHGDANGNRCVFCKSFIDKKGGVYLKKRNKIIPNCCWRCYYKNLKGVVLNKLGNKCKCCNENIKEFLQIDHKFGGGYEAYKTIYQSGVHEDAFFNPQNYQTLCANCNLGRHLNGGKCPHVQKDQKKFSSRLTKNRVKKIDVWVKKNFHPKLHLFKNKD